MTDKPFDFDNFNDVDKEDDLLFDEMIGGVKKIKTNQSQPYQKKRRPVPLNIPLEQLEDPYLVTEQIKIGDVLSYQGNGIQNRLFKDLSSGRIKPEGRLDLHGKRLKSAYKIFNQFIAEAVYHEAYCVHIIHGKGYGSADNKPILKQQVNQWLRQKSEVLAFVSAPSWDGGTGAVYVLLSKKDPS